MSILKPCVQKLHIFLPVESSRTVLSSVETLIKRWQIFLVQNPMHWQKWCKASISLLAIDWSICPCFLHQALSSSPALHEFLVQIFIRLMLLRNFTWLLLSFIFLSPPPFSLLHTRAFLVSFYEFAMANNLRPHCFFCQLYHDFITARLIE